MWKRDAQGVARERLPLEFALRVSAARPCWWLLLAAVLALPLLPLVAQQASSWAALDDILFQASITTQADVEFVVLHQGQEVYRRRTEAFKNPERIPIASASKWLSAATILTLMDDGTLGLDDPVSLYLPSFRGAKAAITLRQLLSHTAGLGGDLPCVFDAATSLDACAERIAERPLLYPPGEAFFYTDASLHIAALVAETASGKPWSLLFAERLSTPLGMTSTAYPNPDVQPNPQVSAGAMSTADDYLRFLQMIRNRGVHDGTRILSRQAVELMLADQTAGVSIRGTLYDAHASFRAGAPLNRYGLGNWLEGMADAQPDANSSQGSFGVSPYWDARRDLLFLAFLRDTRSAFPPFYYQVQDFLADTFPLPSAPSNVPPARRMVDDSEVGFVAWWEALPPLCARPESLCPLLLALPPQGQDPSAFARANGLLALAHREQWILALPELSGIPDADSPVLRTMIAAIAASRSIDVERIFLTGFGDAANRAARIACLDAPQFAALAVIQPVDDALAVLGGCQPHAELPAFFLDPLQDAPNANIAPEDFPAFWSSRNRCSQWRDWQPITLNGFRFQDAYACWPGAAVRVARSLTPVASAGITTANLLGEFLRAQFRPNLREGRIVATSAASYVRRVSAPGALVSLFGLNLTSTLASASGVPLPLSLEGVRVQVRDSRGLTSDASLILVSPLQANIVLPVDIAPGVASLLVIRDGEITHRDWLMIDEHAPALFAATASGEGPPAGEILYVYPDGNRRREWLSVARQSDAGALISPQPIQLTNPDVQVYVSLYGTGWRDAPGSNQPVALVGGVPVEPAFAGPQGQFAGLDQINLRLDGLSLPDGLQPIQIRLGTYKSPALQLLLVTKGAGD